MTEVRVTEERLREIRAAYQKSVDVRSGALKLQGRDDDTSGITPRCIDTVSAIDELLAIRILLDTAATAFRTGFLPPEDWLPRSHALLGLPPTDQKCSQKESADEMKLRRMLAFAYSGAGTLYGDDGELQDNSVRPFIDYVRMSVDEIQQAIQQRGRNLIAVVGQK